MYWYLYCYIVKWIHYGKLSIADCQLIEWYQIYDKFTDYHHGNSQMSQYPKAVTQP